MGALEWLRAVADGGEGRIKSGDLWVHGLLRPDGTPYNLAAVLQELAAVGTLPEQAPRKTMDELEQERRERVRRANEREAAFEQRAREMDKTLPQPAA